jgi:hypothetical protein
MSNYEEDEESPEMILSDLYDVGDTKSLGYLPIETLYEYCNKTVQDIIDFTNEKGLCYQLHKDAGSTGELYVYHEEMLMDILKQHKEILTLAGIPCDDANEFIRYIAYNLVSQEKFPEAYVVIGKTFNDPRFR